MPWPYRYITWQSKLAPTVHIEATATAHRLATHSSFFSASKPSKCSGVARSMVIPGPETEVIGESGSEGLGAQPPDAEKGLILHVLRIS